MLEPITEAVYVRSGDLLQSDFAAAHRARQVAWDIETTGLDWRHDRIGTCQLLIPDYGIVIVQLGEYDGIRPGLLGALLETDQILKVFHYAMFDLCFMMSRWVVDARFVACTKTASRILRPEGPHSLKDLLAVHLAVNVDKSANSARTSDWTRRALLYDQIQYAANDVRYLLPLYQKLLMDLQVTNLLDLAERCFAFLPERVRLELRGSGDPFRY